MTTDNPADRLRTVMAQVPAAVSIVTAQLGDLPHATTVSAFMSLSMEPPMMLVSLDNRSSLLPQIDHGSRIGINVLNDRQADVAARCAVRNKDIDDLTSSWKLDDDRPPRIPDCIAWVDFTVTMFVPAGDHTLVIGTVNEAETTPGAPLVYWQRTYGTHSAA